MYTIKFYDTNVLLDCGEQIISSLQDYEHLYLSSKTLEEIENIKTAKNKTEEVRYKARQASKLLHRYRDRLNVVAVTNKIYDILSDLYIPDSPDNIIIASAIQALKDREANSSLEFYTSDLNCWLMCEYITGIYRNDNITSCFIDNKQVDLYKGYKYVQPTDEQFAEVYSKDISENVFDCNVNEYAIIKDNLGETCDIIKWTGEKYVCVSAKPFKSRAFGTIKPLDDYQRCAFDSITNNDITVLYGKSGCGKTTLPLSYIMSCVESQKYKKCYIISHFETLKGAKTLGYIKGELLQKELQTGSIGNILATKFGDSGETERLIAAGLLEIVPTANIRGMEIPNDCICYITEGQNLDTYTLKTIIQRCRQGCKIIIEGDIIEQHDINRETGLLRMIEVFKGYKGFGVVKLKNNYRSEFAELADML